MALNTEIYRRANLANTFTQEDNTEIFNLHEFLEVKQTRATLHILADQVVKCIDRHRNICALWDHVELREFSVCVDRARIPPIYEVRLDKRKMPIFPTTTADLSGLNQYNLLTRTWGNIGMECDYTQPGDKEYVQKLMFNCLTQQQQAHILHTGLYVDGLGPEQLNEI